MSKKRVIRRPVAVDVRAYFIRLFFKFPVFSIQKGLAKTLTQQSLVALSNKERVLFIKVQKYDRENEPSLLKCKKPTLFSTFNSRTLDTINQLPGLISTTLK